MVGKPLKAYRAKGREYDQSNLAKGRRQKSDMRSRIDRIATAILQDDWRNQVTKYTPQNGPAVNDAEWKKLVKQQDQVWKWFRDRNKVAQRATAKKYPDLENVSSDTYAKIAERNAPKKHTTKKTITSPKKRKTKASQTGGVSTPESSDDETPSSKSDSKGQIGQSMSSFQAPIPKSRSPVIKSEPQDSNFGIFSSIPEPRQPSPQFDVERNGNIDAYEDEGVDLDYQEPQGMVNNGYGGGDGVEYGDLWHRSEIDSASLIQNSPSMISGGDIATASRAQNLPSIGSLEDVEMQNSVSSVYSPNTSGFPPGRDAMLMPENEVPSIYGGTQISPSTEDQKDYGIQNQESSKDTEDSKSASMEEGHVQTPPSSKDTEGLKSASMEEAHTQTPPSSEDTQGLNSVSKEGANIQTPPSSEDTQGSNSVSIEEAHTQTPPSSEDTQGSNSVSMEEAHTQTPPSSEDTQGSKSVSMEDAGVQNTSSSQSVEGLAAQSMENTKVQTVPSNEESPGSSEMSRLDTEIPPGMSLAYDKGDTIDDDLHYDTFIHDAEKRTLKRPGSQLEPSPKKLKTSSDNA
ncbi:hypothetical protein PRZ48_006417 [Zasmidium cellare]|uniref:Uncharacterized protein n=1 Tax=Zasmidium cellare TaxID=395010 RepID=A0ABR0EP21_ZASCE|nr:hypothetical protein PRZ48_006417 [Zasmidium cellare]